MSKKVKLLLDVCEIYGVAICCDNAAGFVVDTYDRDVEDLIGHYLDDLDDYEIEELKEYLLT